MSSWLRGFIFKTWLPKSTGELDVLRDPSYAPWQDCQNATESALYIKASEEAKAFI